MKAIKFTGIAVVTMLMSIQITAQQPKPADAKDRQLVVALSDPGKPFKLNVELVTGSIEVSTYEGKEVVIDVVSGSTKFRAVNGLLEEEKQRQPNTTTKAFDRFFPDRNSENSNGMKRISGGENIAITAREKNNTVTVGSDMPSKPITLVIKIPQGATNIKLNTVNGGNIVGSNLSGQLEVGNTNGAIQLTGISGSVVANTVNGKLTVTFKSLDPKAPMSFTSFNGNVDVTFPAGLKANLKARSDRGQVYSDFDVSPDPAQPKTTKTAKDGMYRLTVEDWVTGKIDGGGPEMMMKTFNGIIYIRKAK